MTNELIFVLQEIDHNHPQFLDGLNMEDDYFDLSGPTESAVEPSGSGATPTSRPPKPKKHTSKVWQPFDKEEIPNPDDRVTTKYHCKFCKLSYDAFPESRTGHLKRHMGKCMARHREPKTITRT